MELFTLYIHQPYTASSKPSTSLFFFFTIFSFLSFYFFFSLNNFVLVRLIHSLDDHSSLSNRHFLFSLYMQLWLYGSFALLRALCPHVTCTKEPFSSTYFSFEHSRATKHIYIHHKLILYM